MRRLLSAGGARLQPELESLALKLIAGRPATSMVQTRVVLYDEDRRLTFSPLASSQGLLYAIILEPDHSYDRIGRAVTRFKLTRRQAEVLALILEGANAGEVASQLSISEYTAQGYIKSLLSKTSSRNRAAMVAKVLEWEQPGDGRARPSMPTHRIASGDER